MKGYDVWENHDQILHGSKLVPTALHSPPKRNMKIKRKEVIYIYIYRDTSKPSQLFFHSCCSTRHRVRQQRIHTQTGAMLARRFPFFHVVFLSLSLVFSVEFQALMHRLFLRVYNRPISLD